jgi:hypothetical protein
VAHDLLAEVDPAMGLTGCATVANSTTKLLHQVVSLLPHLPDRHHPRRPGPDALSAGLAQDAGAALSLPRDQQVLVADDTGEVFLVLTHSADPHVDLRTCRSQREPSCGAEGTRTPGLLHATEALFHLSYSPSTGGVARLIQGFSAFVRSAYFLANNRHRGPTIGR